MCVFDSALVSVVVSGYSSLHIIDLLLSHEFGCASVIVCLGLADPDLSNRVNLGDVTAGEVAWAKVLWRLSLAHWKPLRRQNSMEVEGIRMHCGVHLIIVIYLSDLVQLIRVLSKGLANN